MTTHNVDVLIVGAGISGIDAAVHLTKLRLGTSFVVLEGRAAVGGTWDLFRYPGIRSDSDMFTLGYRFKPWTDAKVIADAPAILRYLHETIAEHQLEHHIRTDHRVVSADWSSAQARWTVEVEHAGGRLTYVCRFLWMCSGYYRYAQGYVPALPGEASFAGPVIHPQQWPEGLDYTGKRVVIIGSGATAVTLVPAMAGQARHVTMLQRSPSYLYPRASQDAIINALRAVFPEKIAYALGRLKNTTMQVYNFLMARAFPQFVGNAVVKLVRERLPAGFDVEKHFRPSYGPWVQRVCLVPDDDFFQAIQAGKASVVTDSITALTPDGITLASGERLAADIIIKATGLELEVAGGVPIRVDGRLIDFAETLTYKGVMYSGVPNFATVFGYLAASWTMRADLIAQYVCRLLRHMEAYGQAVVMPPPRDPHQPTRPLFDFTSGYIQRSLPKLPRQGPAAPWQQSQHYWVDIWRLRLAPVDDGVLQFSRPPAGATDSRIEPAPAAAA